MAGRYVRRAVAYAAIGVLVLLAMPVTAQAVPRQSIAIVGDSISYLTMPSTNEVFSADYRVSDATYPGVEMSTMLPQVKALAATDPTAMIVELGTNDARENNPNWRAAFTAEESVLLSQQCVVLVTVSPRLGPIATGIDTSIDYAALTHSQFHVLDWGNIEFKVPAWLKPDHIHPTTTGSMVLARLELQTVRKGCQ